jgi:hypothetical protein
MVNLPLFLQYFWKFAKKILGKRRRIAIFSDKIHVFLKMSNFRGVFIIFLITVNAKSAIFAKKVTFFDPFFLGKEPFDFFGQVHFF